jgi:hypothetical protein
MLHPNSNRRARGPLFWLLTLLVGLPGALFLLVSVVLLIYTNWPLDLDELTLPEIETQAQHIVIISHGMRDDRSTWSDGLKDTLQARNELAQIISLDWNPYSGSTFRCSVDGKRLGESLGRRLAASRKLKSLHLIAHSCGSFVSLGICEALRAVRSQRTAQSDITIQSTYLDPVTVYGGIFWGFGLERFGRCADFSDAYINASDDVPGSNQLLPATHTFDITGLRIPSGFSGSPHLWPTVYYQNLAESGRDLELRTDPGVISEYPRQVLTTLSEQQ